LGPRKRQSNREKKETANRPTDKNKGTDTDVHQCAAKRRRGGGGGGGEIGERGGSGGERGEEQTNV